MTQRLIASALDRWVELDGYAVAHGVPPLGQLPIGRFVNFVYYWLTEGADRPSIDKFRARLWQPPPGVAAVGKDNPWSPENEAKAFGALKSALTGTAVASGD